MLSTELLVTMVRWGADSPRCCSYDFHFHNNEEMNNDATGSLTIRKYPTPSSTPSDVVHCVTLKNIQMSEWRQNKIIYLRCGYRHLPPLFGFQLDLKVTARIWAVIHLLNTNGQVKKPNEEKSEHWNVFFGITALRSCHHTNNDSQQQVVDLSPLSYCITMRWWTTVGSV